ncbi:B-cell receptor CD22 isoform X1 [Takifugu flavidus]|uniref:B-cell receptor CD22 isoform X1 n=1 Tax=Takifugu flavidus TaxID=433684 RepID=UPI002544B23D|nr:B-cell receptor CD22 isoform X1 [Takifugu flavidus]XP_056900779.1 B-cell receptor CD22 isoform X1 [Takifugu flavidus]
MKMKAQTFWFLFLSLAKNVSPYYTPQYFKLEDHPLTATEGSCAEIKCHVSEYVDIRDSNWFWMKDAIWDDEKKDFNSTIIYSSNNSLYPVSPAFATRVKYVGSASTTWTKPSSSPRCSILICNLEKGDNGEYRFRSKGNIVWTTKTARLSIIENRCPVTLENHPVVKDSDNVVLRCSTVASCPHELMLTSVPQKTFKYQECNKTFVGANFTASWEDDGMEISCQVRLITDPYLIQNMTLRVEYEPKNVIAEVTPLLVKQGQPVTFSCSARGQPYPNFTWFQNGSQVSKLAQWNITSVAPSQNGNYYCVANNTHGEQKSNEMDLTVQYKPYVELKESSGEIVLNEGKTLSLSCILLKSNPEPGRYTWYKNQKLVSDGPSKHYVKPLEPDDSGSYTCAATNSIGTGTSNPVQIKVQYSPRRTNISLSKDNNVKVGQDLDISCVTAAEPFPQRFSWYRYKNKTQVDSQLWMSTHKSTITLKEVQRSDEACYICNATNAIGTGEKSKPKCIVVHYAPTNLLLVMNSVATEGELVTINCTVESFPLAQLTLTKMLATNSSPEYIQLPSQQHVNQLSYTVNATAAHAGFYNCTATNAEGSQTKKNKLLVRYAPKNVMVQPESGLNIKENTSLTLQCNAKSYPEVTSFTWMKWIDGKPVILQNTQTFTLESVSPSDSGQYSCRATNAIGTGNSQQAVVHVLYAPKQTKIRILPEMEHEDGKSFVTLICSAQCYPPANHFSWYKKGKDPGRDAKMSEREMFTVYSDQPGIYYCIAKNEINERESEPVTLFAGGGFIKFFIIFLAILLVFAIIFFAHRHKNHFQWNKSCFACPSDGRGRNNQSVSATPSRSRDDLLPDQPCTTEAQRWRPHADSTPMSSFDNIYYHLQLHPAAMTSSEENPVTQMEDDSLNYAALQFGNGNKPFSCRPKAKEEMRVVANAIVSQKHSPETTVGSELEDYENFSVAQAVQPSNQLNDDSAETSEDETELSYTTVNFLPKSGLLVKSRTCDGEETEYSDVQF